MTDDLTGIAQNWLNGFETGLQKGDVSDCFVPQPFWRDLLSFTWNIITCESADAIASMVSERANVTSAQDFQLESAATDPQTGALMAWFRFKTSAGAALGIVRLMEGRAFTLFTRLTDLDGFPLQKGSNRPVGTQHGASRDRVTWQDQRAADTAAYGRSTEPHVLVIGGGQGGLAVAARLKQYGVPALVIEKNKRAGDSWRNRYDSLVLHDPVWVDHLPYMPFPDTWPVFTPKDKMGDWLEAYCTLMEIDIWCSSTVSNAKRDDDGRWTVTVQTDDGPKVVRPAEIVFATGLHGPAKKVAFPGMENFGGTLMHSSAYKDGAGFKGLKCAVVGAGSSAHDVAADLWEAGADVTMVQRSPTTVVRSETLVEMAIEPLYSEQAVANGVTPEIADEIVASMPIALWADGHRQLFGAMRERDADFYAALENAGQLIDFGEDESGLILKALRTGAGYYIDVGASQLIIDGEISIASGADIETLTETGIKLSDGQTIDADVIVASIGYEPHNATVASIISEDTAETLGRCGGIGSGVRGDPGPWHGEVRNLWKPTPVEGLWCHGGNLAMSRYYSDILALQLKARHAGLPVTVYNHPLAS